MSARSHGADGGDHRRTNSERSSVATSNKRTFILRIVESVVQDLEGSSDIQGVVVGIEGEQDLDGLVGALVISNCTHLDGLRGSR